MNFILHYQVIYYISWILALYFLKNKRLCKNFYSVCELSLYFVYLNSLCSVVILMILILPINKKDQKIFFNLKIISRNSLALYSKRYLFVCFGLVWILGNNSSCSRTIPCSCSETLPSSTQETQTSMVAPDTCSANVLIFVLTTVLLKNLYFFHICTKVLLEWIITNTQKTVYYIFL